MSFLHNLAYLLVFHLALSYSTPVALQPSPAHCDSVWTPPVNNAKAAGIIFKSVDGGQTWQDISEGLPAGENNDGMELERFFANDRGLYLPAANGLYRSIPDADAPFWTKEMYTDKQMQLASGQNIISTANQNGNILPVTPVANAWWPEYTTPMQAAVYNVFKTSAGITFVTSENGFYRSRNEGHSWEKVFDGSWHSKLAESNGVLLATSQHGIMKSTDDGETWNYAIREGGVGIAVEAIAGGFATVSFNTSTQTRRIHISHDDGKTWKSVESGLKPSMNISSVKQMGGYLFCGHPDGIFSSSDEGKTWKLLLPSVGNKVFNLSVSGKVIYAVAQSGGC